MISLKSGASSPADRQTPMAVAETSPSYWQHQPTHGLGQVGRSATAPAVGSFPPGQLGSGLSGLGSSSPLRVASPSPMATAPKVSPELRFADVRPSLLRHGSSPGGGVTGRRLRQSPGGSQVAVTFGATSLIDIKASPSMPVTAPSSAGHHGSNGTPPVNGLGGEPRRRGVRVQLGEGAAETSRRGWPWWAAGELRGDLERLRLGYAGLLERWGSEFDHERLWVLKLCHPRLDVGRGGKAGVEGWTHARIKAGNGVDSTTGPALGSAVEGAQESALPLMQAAQCALCHLPVPCEFLSLGDLISRLPLPPLTRALRSSRPQPSRARARSAATSSTSTAPAPGSTRPEATTAPPDAGAGASATAGVQACSACQRRRRARAGIRARARGLARCRPGVWGVC